MPKDDEAVQPAAVDSATAELRQSLQQEHDRRRRSKPNW